VAVLIPTGFLGCKVAGLLHPREVQAGGREFRDFRSVAAADLYLEDVRAYQRAGGAFVHGEETIANPVPAVVAVGIVNPYHDFHLGLSPEARPVGRAQTDPGIELRGGVLAIRAGQLDPGLIVRIFSQIVIRQNFKAHPFSAGHLVFGMEFHPFPPGADAVAFALIGTERHALSAGRQRCRANNHQRQNNAVGLDQPLSSMKKMRRLQALLQNSTIPLPKLNPRGQTKVA